MTTAGPITQSVSLNSSSVNFWGDWEPDAQNYAYDSLSGYGPASVTLTFNGASLPAYGFTHMWTHNPPRPQAHKRGHLVSWISMACPCRHQ